MYDALKSPESGIYALTESLKYDKERFECVHLLIATYLVNGMTEIAFKYYECVRDYYETKYPDTSFFQKLFVSHDIPNFLFPYNMIVLSDRVKQHTTGVKMYSIIFRNQHVPKNHWYLGHLYNNLAYFIQYIPVDSAKLFAQELHTYVNLCKEAKYVPTPQQEAIFKEVYNKGKDLSTPVG
jgi:hypothetical protein